MSKAKPKKYRTYFNDREMLLIKPVADTMKVSIPQFIKGAAIEIARATIEMARQMEEASHEQERTAEETDETSRGEQPSTEAGVTEATSDTDGSTVSP